MGNYSFYPFGDVEFSKISAKELECLRVVSEGWYVDYKSSSIKIDDYAKHLSAFANQYGGWLIVGVAESPERKAESFGGIAKKDIESELLKIREASSAHCNPPVFYEEHVVYGPCPEIGLSENNGIVIIGIPRSERTPHIHSSGRIYRRLADQSKPKEETDRHILDDLWKRNNTFQDQLREFLVSCPQLPESQKNHSWVYIYLLPDKAEHTQRKPVEIEDLDIKIKEISMNDEVIPMVPLDSVTSFWGGLIARQIKNNRPDLASLGFRYWVDGRVRFEIPINSYNVVAIGDDSGLMQRYTYLQRYVDLLGQLGCSRDAKIIDCSYLFAVILAFSRLYTRLQKLHDDYRSVRMAIFVKNVNYALPFVNSTRLIHKLEEGIVPVCVDSDFSIPRRISWENLLLVNSEDWNNPSDGFFKIPARLIYEIFNGLGLVNKIEDLTHNGDIFIGDWF